MQRGSKRSQFSWDELFANRGAGTACERPTPRAYRAVNPEERKPPPHGGLDEAASLEWLVRRQAGQRALCWIAALMFVFPGFAFLLMRFFPMTTGGSLPLGFYSLYQLSWVGDALLAWAACRFFFEARRSGELELLLTTPAGAQALVSAHWTAMKRLLRWPAVVVITPLLLQGGLIALFTIGSNVPVRRCDAEVEMVHPRRL